MVRGVDNDLPRLDCAEIYAMMNRISAVIGMNVFVLGLAN